MQILCTTQTRENHLDTCKDTNDLPETPSVPSSASPKTAIPPYQVEEPLSPLGVLDCSPAHSPKPCSPHRHLSFSPVINIQSPSASCDSIITRRDFTKLVSNIYIQEHALLPFLHRTMLTLWPSLHDPGVARFQRSRLVNHSSL